ncbi:class I SAM-dependent methyltransferase [Methanobrevibacter sp. OttesenSCG-928-K11]|nr:class I SAM-dependent methyltransferase [Methanobrevibacter sp. OttesenSCG-928-K11]MDL2270489.1 class I SAM-dependent methyltransferase [Methanobrevibacter sp. OttesenSCG-928-I08]
MNNSTDFLKNQDYNLKDRSSEDSLDINGIFNKLNLKGNENFLDAGCGDGHAAIEALKYLKNGTVYALDIYELAIDNLKKFKEKENIDNLIPILADITDKIDLDNETLDIILMINVFHEFKAVKRLNESVEELKRILKPSGKIAIMDFKKEDIKQGPPYEILSSPEELEKLFKKHGFKHSYLNNEIGEDNSHFFIIFEKL